MTFYYNFHAENEFSGINVHEIDMSHAYAYINMKALVVPNDHIVQLWTDDLQSDLENLAIRLGF